MSSGFRSLVVVRGSRAETRERIRAWRRRQRPHEALWVSEELDVDTDASTVPPRRLGTMLGRAFDLVVLEAHGGLDADALGQAHGLVWGGGALVISVGDTPMASDPLRERLAAWPYLPDAVGHRFEARLQRALATGVDLHDAVLGPRFEARGTDEQEALVSRLVGTWSSDAPSRVAITADRGRGKSSAIGLALRRWLDAGPDREAWVTAGDESAAREVLRFAGPGASFVPLAEVLGRSAVPPVVAVDEAAQLPVPLLRRLVRDLEGRHLAFATTVHGYEGTGRGFSVRFLDWLQHQSGGVTRLQMREPIRWSAGDPLERTVFDGLMLDAAPAEIDTTATDAPIRCVRVDRDTLAADEPRLRQLFGLLVQAHYRTTPSDLHRILDAPNLRLHAAMLGDAVVGATLVAEEGGFARDVAEGFAAGTARPRAHALADVLAAQLGHPEAATLNIRRSVRIAVLPEVRRRGIATALVEHVHRTEPADLWGTLFGATAGLIAFRRSVGYEVAGVSASRGARTGEPALLMLRPQSERARALLSVLRSELARELAGKLELLAADDGLPLDRDLARSVERGLPERAPYTAEDAVRVVRAYCDGPRTFESASTAIRTFVGTRSLRDLPESERTLVETRVMERRSWADAARLAGLDNPRVAMRALRRALRHMVASAGDV